MLRVRLARQEPASALHVQLEITVLSSPVLNCPVQQGRIHSIRQKSVCPVLTARTARLARPFRRRVKRGLSAEVANQFAKLVMLAIIVSKGHRFKYHAVRAHTAPKVRGRALPAPVDTSALSGQARRLFASPARTVLKANPFAPYVQRAPTVLKGHKPHQPVMLAHTAILAKQRALPVLRGISAFKAQLHRAFALAVFIVLRMQEFAVAVRPGITAP